MSSKEIELIWKEYYPKVFGYFYRRLNSREDVEDLTSLVMTYYLDSLSKSEIQNPHAYLWRIAHNQLATFIREKSKNPVYVSIHEDESFEWLDENLEKDRSAAYTQRVEALLECAKRSLKDEEYNLVASSFLEEKNSTELSAELNTKAATIRKRLSRSLVRLREKCLSIWQGFQTQNQNKYAQ